MLAPTVDTPQKARQVIARFARGDFHQSDIRASLPTGQHALISHLLDSINAHCPPLTLAMKIGISEMNSSHQRFTVEYETEAELTAKVDGWRQLDGTARRQLNARQESDLYATYQGVRLLTQDKINAIRSTAIAKLKNLDHISS